MVIAAGTRLPQMIVTLNLDVETGSPVGGIGAAGRDYAQDVLYIAKSTWMCGVIVSGLQGTPIVRCDYL